MGWNGDISQMGQLADRIADLARIPSRAAGKVSKRLAGLIQEEFSEGEDPYGDPWAALRPATLEKHGPPPLTDSGTMRGKLEVRPLSGAGVGVTLPHPAQAHQAGFNNARTGKPVAARPTLPARDELPDTWLDVIESEIRKEFSK